jgi:hypothetical protein
VFDKFKKTMSSLGLEIKTTIKKVEIRTVVAKKLVADFLKLFMIMIFQT